MLRNSGKKAANHRFTYGLAKAGSRHDPRIVNLAFELLCNALPSGAVVLDSRCHVIFANREGTELLRRWNDSVLPVRDPLPPELLAACERLRRGQSNRPKFGGRIFLRHPHFTTLSAVVALDRSQRDRRVAVFCVFLQDRLNDSVVGGRRDQLAMLTMAERRVAKLVAGGLRNREIATNLGKSITTVKSQLSAIFGKLQVRSRTELATLLRSA
jgi:DNA-binding CsgD family transcriptional regulator